MNELERLFNSAVSADGGIKKKIATLVFSDKEKLKAHVESHGFTLKDLGGNNFDVIKKNGKIYEAIMATPKGNFYTRVGTAT